MFMYNHAIYYCFEMSDVFKILETIGTHPNVQESYSQNICFDLQLSNPAEILLIYLFVWCIFCLLSKPRFFPEVLHFG
jgi:hypothetical protein